MNGSGWIQEIKPKWNRMETHENPNQSKFTRGMYLMLVFIHLKRLFVHFINIFLFFFFSYSFLPLLVLIRLAHNMNVFAIESLAKCLFHKCVSKCGVILLAAASNSGFNSENGITFGILQHNILDNNSREREKKRKKNRKYQRMR